MSFLFWEKSFPFGFFLLERANLFFVVRKELTPLLIFCGIELTPRFFFLWERANTLAFLLWERVDFGFSLMGKS